MSSAGTLFVIPSFNLHAAYFPLVFILGEHNVFSYFRWQQPPEPKDNFCPGCFKHIVRLLLHFLHSGNQVSQFRVQPSSDSGSHTSLIITGLQGSLWGKPGRGADIWGLPTNKITRQNHKLDLRTRVKTWVGIKALGYARASQTLVHLWCLWDTCDVQILIQ